MSRIGWQLIVIMDQPRQRHKPMVERPSSSETRINNPESWSIGHMPGIAIRYQNAAGPRTGSCSPHEGAVVCNGTQTYRSHSTRSLNVTSLQNVRPKYRWYSYTMGRIQPENYTYLLLGCKRTMRTAILRRVSQRVISKQSLRYINEWARSFKKCHRVISEPRIFHHHATQKTSLMPTTGLVVDI